MPAARSQGAKGSLGAKENAGGDQNGADGQSLVVQERGRPRKSVKRTAESSSQTLTGVVVKKPLGRPRKRPKLQASEEVPIEPVEGNETEPQQTIPKSPPANGTVKTPRKRNGQKSKRRVTKTLLVNGQKLGGSSEALESSETPGRLRRRRASKESKEIGGHDEAQFKENGSKNLRSHVKASKGASAAGSSEDINEGEQDDDSGKQRKRRRKRRKSGMHSHVDDKLRIKRRVKNLVNRIRQEQNFIDAYAGEGWKGQSREKIRPEKELQRAESQILRCKLAIRESIHELDNLGLEGSLQQSAFDEEGRIFHEEIFCAKCKSQDAHIDNDIILCDGACDRGFHQECLEPPLATADIPPGDEGWLCPVCDSKVECLNYMNGYLGTEFHVEDQWEDLFAEDAEKAAGGCTSNAMEEDWPSEDSEDDDYDPERPKVVKDEDDEEKKAPDSLDSSSDSGSESEATSGSAASSDDDSDNSLVSGDELAHQGKRRQRKDGGDGRIPVSEDVDANTQDHANILSAEEEEVAAVSGKRQRKPVDYKKLHDEMFGKADVDDDDQPSEDEEWGPGRGRRRGRAEAVNGGVKPDTNGADTGKEPAKEPKRRNRRKSTSAQVANGQQALSGQQSDDGKTYRRLPDNAVEMLRQEFDSGTCFPTRVYKETLAEKLGISYQQICSWFKNARHAAKIGMGHNSTPKMSRKKENAATSELFGSGDDGIDEIEVTNGILVEKLDEVHMKLQQLKHTLEAIISTSETSNGNRHTGRSADGIPENGVVLSNGRRVVYVPVAEVVEKES
ncbi:hypothetical protein Mapa_008449 [Marchantia paleacea]|nr:hypothetical protein Mapa_008449 [Marchantia paleacea]